MDDLASRTPEELITLIRGLQATVARQAEKLALLDRRIRHPEADRQPTMAVGHEYITERRAR